MKVLQTLGVHASTQQPGIFQYKRDQKGVYIDLRVGQTESKDTFYIDHDTWAGLLKVIDDGGRKTFPLSGDDSLYSRIKGAVAELTDSHVSCIAAILEHEGSVDHYGGVIGGGEAVSIYLRKDTAAK